MLWVMSDWFYHVKDSASVLESLEKISYGLSRRVGDTSPMISIYSFMNNYQGIKQTYNSVSADQLSAIIAHSGPSIFHQIFL